MERFTPSRYIMSLSVKDGLSQVAWASARSDDFSRRMVCILTLMAATNMPAQLQPVPLSSFDAKAKALLARMT
jgi:hypothetical protein